MTEDEYLELKEWLPKGILCADELRAKIPTYDRLYIPSFEIDTNRVPPTEEQIKKHNADMEQLEELWNQEEYNNFAIDLILAYEVGQGIK